MSANEDPSKRKNISFPASFELRLAALRKRNPHISESQLLKQGLVLLEAVTDPKSVLLFRDRRTGKDTEVLIL